MNNNLSELAKTSHEVSRSKGWWDDGPKPDSTLITLMHSEVSEALEDFRMNHAPNESWLETTAEHGGVKYSIRDDVNGVKPCGVPSELSDIIIRIGDYFGGRGLDLEAAYKRTLDLEPIKGFEQGLARIHYALSMAWGSSQEFLSEGNPLLDNSINVNNMLDGKTYWLAMAVRYTFDLAKIYGIDLWHHIELKTEYNKTRAHRHGGKRI
jgi:hypothetical protein